MNFVEKGVEVIKQAVDEDNKQNYPEAIKFYVTGVDYFMTALKYEKNERSKSMLRSKTAEYMDRIEYLKEKQKKAAKPQAAAIGGARPDDADAEKQKLFSNIEGAIVREKPNVRWDDVVGLEGAKSALREAVIYPIRFPHLFTGKRKPWKGILLFGIQHHPAYDRNLWLPEETERAKCDRKQQTQTTWINNFLNTCSQPPGTGKSYLAKAVATEVESTFFSISSSDLVSKWLGESEKLVRSLFEMARSERPAIVFIDEIDSLATTRGDNESEAGRRIKTELLVQMQGVGKSNDGVLVLGATNVPWMIDPAIRRRFEKRIYIPLPELAARQTMFKVHLGDTKHSLTDQDFADLAARTDGYSGSDIAVVVRDAIMEPIRKLQVATHFKRVIVAEDGPKEVWVPCSPGDPEAQQMDLMQIQPASVRAPDIGKADFYKALRNVRSSVSQDDIKRHEEWTHEFGMEGN